MVRYFSLFLRTVLGIVRAATSSVVLSAISTSVGGDAAESLSGCGSDMVCNGASDAGGKGDAISMSG